MDDNNSTRTEIVYRSIIESLYSEVKKQLKTEEDKKQLKEVKDVKIYVFIFLYLNSSGYQNWLMKEYSFQKL